MAVNISGKITSSSTAANLDSKYGPYESVDDAWDTLGPDGDDIAAEGLTFGVKTTGDKLIEYWFLGGTAKSNIVLKAQQPTIIYGGKAPTVSQLGGEE